ncbi:MAG: ABC transporter ATP-binding protein, partial [Dehalococcoidia bacterium]|nr:ABC transporter ATP-binding protein [Dehalococcoidia bacterium]
GIADVLVKDPSVVFLDEPTIGIDPDGVHRVLTIINQISREQNITVFLSSHLLHQVQTICDRIGIMVKGKLVTEGSMASLGKDVSGFDRVKIEVQATGTVEKLSDTVGHLEGVKGIERSGDLLIIDAERDIRILISNAISKQGESLLHLKLQEFVLEEIYMRYFH